MDKTAIKESVEKCVRWIKEQMSSFDYASWGIYERIRIDENQRICCVRPDCNAEFLNVLDLHERLNGSDKNPHFENIFRWLKKVQNTEETVGKGSYNFYFLDGAYKDEAAQLIYQNDNGKVLYNLGELYERTQREEIVPIMRALADFWIECQTEEGYFYDSKFVRMHCWAKGPCFVVWMMVGLYKAWKIVKDNRYYVSANKALEYCLDVLILEDRIHTSYELEKFEDWRPYSSEVSILLLGLSEAYENESDASLKEKIIKKRRLLSKLLLEMQHESGAILNNGDYSVEGLTLQEGGFLADLVYTEGFAIRALIKAYEVFCDEAYLQAAKKLAAFLLSIQCIGESPYWDGAWRGSYNVKEKRWAGRCNQNNQIDEGGMYSVYTGWCCTNIMLGLLSVEKYL